jgi:putative tryptophan/tyrosine transport system substrate-binding protein
MRRREFIALAASAALVSRRANAQQRSGLPLIAFLSPVSAAAAQLNLDAFRQGMAGLGFEEGRNFTLVARFGGGDPDVIKRAASELIALKPDVIVAGATEPALTVRAATATIPIVMVGFGADPEKLGLAQALAHPGGNVTGNLFYALTTSGNVGTLGKRLALLTEFVPGLSRVGVMFNPDDEQDAFVPTELPSAAAQLNVQLRSYLARNNEEVEKALAAMEGNDDAAFFISGSPLLNINRAVVAERILVMKRPAIGSVREQTVAGLLVTYGASIPDNYRGAADYVAKILRGTRPGDLPIQQAVKFDLIINLKTAKAFGLAVPPTLLARADEVIE